MHSIEIQNVMSFDDIEMPINDNMSINNAERTHMEDANHIHSKDSYHNTSFQNVLEIQTET
jgi:hypothetical protein